MAEEFIESQEMLAFYDMLRGLESRDKVEMLNPKRLMEMQKTYKTLQDIILEESPNAKFDCHIHTFEGSAGIKIEVDELVIHSKKMKSFLESMKCVTNFEVYPLTNGKIAIGLKFKGVVNRTYED